jgi:hypothetical protein
MLAGAIVLIPNAPLELLTFAAQTLAGILLPSATVFLVLLITVILLVVKTAQFTTGH